MSLGILTLSSAIGQTVTLSPSNTPKPEFRYNYNKVDFDYSIALDTGMNVVWDLSNMVILNEVKSFYYTKNPNYISFPNHEDHPNPSIDTGPSETDTTLLRSDNVILKITDTLFFQAYSIREEEPGLFDAYVNNEAIPTLKFPFDYNSSMELENWVIDHWNGYYSSLYSWKEGDATGSLITPDSLITNLLRIHTSHDRTPWGGLSMKRNTYEWYSQNSDTPLFKVEYKYSYYNDPMGVIESGHDTTAWLLTSIEYVPPSLYENQNDLIYPNPSSSHVSLKTNSKINTISIFDTEGKFIQSINGLEPNAIEMYLEINEIKWMQRYTLDVGNLITGVYYMRYTLENGKVLNKRFMVEN